MLDATTLWLFREKLANAGLIEKQFERFDRHLAAKGYIARGGQIVDATIVPVPKQRNSRDDNDTVKAGETPAEWKKKPAKLRQKDRDARGPRSTARAFLATKQRQCGRQAQADPALRGDRCGCARQPGARRAIEQGQHVVRCVRRQRLSFGRS